ncbi:MAG: RNA polymerase sigma factor [Brevundimonas sp.]|nr:RNA polymerase sigma factor [Brevundimonas sp.]MDP3405687.1 RNA polymerase sigma factor [Brevundimonas sp.]
MDTLGDLPARAAAGDRAAFSDLMRQTKSALFRFIRRYVGDEQEAQDLLQESYAAAWLGLRRYDPNRSFEAWLRTIALNKCRDWSRRRFVRRLVSGSKDLTTPEALSVSDGAEPIDDQMEIARSLTRLNREISVLAPHLKEPLLLTAIEGRSQSEAADILGISIKAVETRVARARRKLFEALSDSGPPPSR